MTSEEKIRRLDTLEILTARQSAIVDRLTRSHESAPTPHGPAVYAIVGEPLTGKTTTARACQAKAAEGQSASGHQQTTLAVAVPSLPGVRSIVTGILDALGDPNPARGTVASLASRLSKRLQERGVSLLLLGEFHHCLDETSPRGAEGIFRWIREMVDRAGVSVAAIGLPSVLPLLAADEHLCRRLVPCVLEAFAWDKAADRGELCSFLEAFEARLPFTEPSRLGTDDMARRLCAASEGRIGTLTALLRGAARLAIESNARCITHDFLAAAYRSEVGTGTLPDPFLGESHPLSVEPRPDGRSWLARLAERARGALRHG